MRAGIKIFGMALIMVAISCSEDIKSKPFTYSRMISGQNSKTWKIIYSEIAVNGEVVEAFTEDCTSDDRYIFYANVERSMELKSGASRCFDEPSTIIDTWSYNSGTTTLTMPFPRLADFNIPFILRDLNDDDMEIEIFLNAENTVSWRSHLDAIDED